MGFKLLFVCFFFLLTLEEFPPIEKPVKKGDANFVYHCDVVPDGKRFSANYWIQNKNPERPLSIGWKAADLKYFGRNAIAPGKTSNIRTRTLFQPFRLDEIPIKYGIIKLDTEPAPCYIEHPKNSDLALLEESQTIQQLNEDGKSIFRVDLTAMLSKETQTSILKFKVSAGTTCIFNEPDRMLFNSLNPISTNLWQITRDTSLNAMLSEEKFRNSEIQDWLNPTNEKRSSQRYFKCTNNSTTTQELTLVANSPNLGITQLNFISYSSDRNYGAIGFASNVYQLK